jgi:hypothetical protein
MQRIAATSGLVLAAMVLSFLPARATPGFCAFPFLDANGNGEYEEDTEPRLPGWRCRVSGAQGGACFLLIPTGRFEACLTLQAGFEATTPICQLVDVGSSGVEQLFFGVRPIPGGGFPSDAPETGADGAVGLGQSFPNPFREGVWITYRARAEESGPVRLLILDANGRVVRALQQDLAGAGALAFHWDGRDERGAEVPAGVYFYDTARGEGMPHRMIRIR